MTRTGDRPAGCSGGGPADGDGPSTGDDRATDEPRVLVLDNYDSLARTFFGARRSARRKTFTKNPFEVGRP